MSRHNAAVVAPADTVSRIEILQDRDYNLMDGSIAIVGNDGMETVIEPMCRIFEARYPGVKFDLTMRGSATAIPALGVGASIFAPMSRDPWAGDLASFRKIKGYDPTPIRFGYTGHGPRPGARTPPAIWVHADNPLEALSLEDVARIYSSGHPKGDINLWGQLGLSGGHSRRRIHLYGCRDDGKFATGFRDAWLAGRNYSAGYEPLKDRVEVLKAVSRDPFGIGAIGWYDPALVSPDLKVVAISETAGTPAYTPMLEHVRQGLYPMSAYLSIYLDLPPGERLSSFIKAFLQIALSHEGQDIVAAQTHSQEGYVPLSQTHIAQQIERLNTL